MKLYWRQKTRSIVLQLYCTASVLVNQKKRLDLHPF